MTAGFIVSVLLTTQWVMDAPPATPPRWSLTAAEASADAADIIDSLVRRAEAAGTDLEGVDLYLMAGNWLLSYSLEPMATRVLLGAPEPDDGAEVAQVLAKAQTQLDAANRILETLKEGGSGGDWRARSHRLAILRAFATGLAALSPESSGPPQQREEWLRQAAADLALVLEDDRPEVAGGALFWQAYLYAAREHHTRALDLLPAALEPPRTGDALGLYARLVRCRLIVREQQGYAAALALLARIEERCGEWFEAQSQKDAARRAAALVRRQLTEEWGRTFQADDQPARAEWCAESVAKIDRTYFAADAPAEVLRLGRAIPAVVDLEAARAMLAGQEAAASGSPEAPAVEEDEALTTNGPNAPTTGFESPGAGTP